tara:strand:- start:905 stop:1420 length:516 start_codon:yes stop_codon:yes gene_type:complete
LDSIKHFQGKNTKRVIEKDFLKEKLDWEKTGKEMKVECHWMERKLLYINCDGQVFPCCFFATRWFETIYRKGDRDRWTRLVNHIPQMQEYVDRIDDFNVEKKPLTEIAKDPLFNDNLVDSWNSYDTVPKQCRDHCSNARPKDGYFTGQTELGNSKHQKDAGEFVVERKDDE